MKTLKIVKYTCIVTFILLLLVTSISAKKYVLEFNHALSDREPFHAGFLEWAEKVKKRTNGDVEIKIIHSAQLGMEKDMIEQLRQGIDIGQSTDAAHLSIYVPELAVLNVSYFIDSIDDVKKLKTLPVVKDWLAKLDEEYNIKVLSFFWIQGFKLFVTNKPIRTPLDLKELRIRSSDVPVEHTSILNYGANHVDLSFGEIYSAAQYKIIDGCELVYDSLLVRRFYEVFKYVNETEHALLVNFVVTSSDFFNDLPAKYQEIIEEECNNAGLKTSSLIMSKNKNNIKRQLKEKGMIIIEDVNRDSFKKAGEQISKILKLIEVRDRIYNQLGKNKN